MIFATSLAACSDAPKSNAPVQEDAGKTVSVMPPIAPEILAKSVPAPVAPTAPVIETPLTITRAKPKPRPYVSPTKFSDGFAKFLRFAPDITLPAAERKIRKRMAPISGVERHSFTYVVERDGQEYVVTAAGEDYADTKLKGERLVLVFKGRTAQEATMISYGAQFKCYRNVDPNIWQIKPCR